MCVGSPMSTHMHATIKGHQVHVHLRRYVQVSSSHYNTICREARAARTVADGLDKVLPGERKELLHWERARLQHSEKNLRAQYAKEQKDSRLRTPCT